MIQIGIKASDENPSQHYLIHKNSSVFQYNNINSQKNDSPSKYSSG